MPPFFLFVVLNYRMDYLSNRDFTSHLLDYREKFRLRLKFQLLSDPGVCHVDYSLQLKAAESSFKVAEGLLVQDFILLVQRLLSVSNLRESDFEDATQSALMVCLSKLNRFDAKKGNAFNFFTTICLNAFRQHCRSVNNFDRLRLKAFGAGYSGGKFRNGREVWE